MRKRNLFTCALGLTSAVVIVLSASFALAEEPVELVLWPDGPPGLDRGEKQEIVVNQDDRIGRRVVKVTRPALYVYKPDKEKDTGAAVVICPGGGYNILALDLEGTEIAHWLNDIGVTGVVLQYRVPRSKTEPKHAAPLQDAQRAIGLARQHADKWNIDPQRIGLMGFSAGGHLTTTAGTNFDERSYSKVDEADELSCRPDFLLLVYAAYLTAEDSDVQLAPELHVNSNTPPAFLVHTGDDRISAANSIAFYLALKKANVPAELHVFPTGGHGYGLRPSEHAVSSWPKLAERWLNGLGVLDKKSTE